MRFAAVLLLCLGGCSGMFDLDSQSCNCGIEDKEDRLKKDLRRGRIGSDEFHYRAAEISEHEAWCDAVAGTGYDDTYDRLYKDYTRKRITRDEYEEKKARLQRKSGHRADHR